MSEKDEFILAYAQRLETQYFDKPKARAHIEYHAEVMYDLMVFYKNIISELDIDSARGVWLDNIGEIIGFSRNVSSILPAPFFAFRDSWILAMGFADKFDDSWIGGPFYSQGQMLTEGTILDDHLYRRCLKAKAAKNNSGGFLVADYTDRHNYRISINDVVVPLFNGYAYVTEGYMTLNLVANLAEINVVELALFIAGDLLPHPMGVDYSFITYEPDKYFGFDPIFEGFGDKYDDSVGGIFAERTSARKLLTYLEERIAL